MVEAPTPKYNIWQRAPNEFGGAPAHKLFFMRRSQAFIHIYYEAMRVDIL
jgi:hypothetical protein